MYRSTTLSYEYNEVPFLQAVGSAFLGFLVYLICITLIVSVQLAIPKPEAAKTSPDLFLPTAVPSLDRIFEPLRDSDPIGRLAQKITRAHRRPDPIGWSTQKVAVFFRPVPRDVGRGLLNYDASSTVTAISSGHLAAFFVLLLTLIFYVWIGRQEFLRLVNGEPPAVPALCYVLLLLMVLCWGLSGLTFILDRWRIPVLIPIVALLAITSWKGPDYFYPVMGREQTYTTEAPSNDSIIVVAANGGGIQAAAWTARVLTGLEEKCRKACNDDFGGSVRLISSVSGGSVGTMYFVNEYTNGRLPDRKKELEQIVGRAKGSGLDQIAWGLLYPDLARTFIPFPLRMEWDRGRTLEEAWLRKDMPWDNRMGIKEGLSEWRKDAEEGRRPAVIFNTTIVETGERLPLGTTKLPQDSPGQIGVDRLLGDAEPSIITAVRLSASFPYVSPAARADVSVPQQAHLVDGGYYDNYGISSLVDWLDEELEGDSRIRRVLVLEIRGAPSGPGARGQEENCPTEPLDPRDPKSNQQWFFQILAPPSTALNVRNTGQRTHNDVELDLLQGKWATNEGHRVEITRAVFEFDGADPPLSWHLTEQQKRRIEEEWRNELEEPNNRCAGWKRVKNFMNEQAEGNRRQP
jgi:hypothetical protein